MLDENGRLRRLAGTVLLDFGPYPAEELTEAANVVAELYRRMATAVGSDDGDRWDTARLRALLAALNLASSQLPPLLEQIALRLEQLAPELDTGGDFDAARAAMVAALAVREAAPFNTLVTRSFTDALRHLPAASERGGDDAEV